MTVFLTKDGGHTFEPTFEGATLYDRERNGYHDSDFYALVWDEEQGKVRDIEYGTTRFANTPRTALVDATDEVWEKAWAWAEEQWIERARREAERKAQDVEVGMRVRVVRGRKVPIGTEGVVLWMDGRVVTPRYRNGYKRGPDYVAVGIATTDRTELVQTWEVQEVEGEGLTVKAPFDTGFNGTCRKLGGKWDKLHKVWRFKRATEETRFELIDECTERFPPKTRYLDTAKTYVRNLEPVEPNMPTEKELREKAHVNRKAILPLFQIPGFILMA